ncbi:MAG: MFS transporter [Gammaproteobacteria bacterium]|nr:MFS transporter [Gammaproteobacteria bacterium]
MLSKILSIYSLLLAIGILLIGTGMLGTALSIHAGLENFSDTVTGIIMSAFFLGFVIGSYVCPRLISQVGHIRAFAVLAAFGTVSVILHGLIVDPVAWWLLRVVTGIAMVGLYLVVESWLNTLIPNHQRGRIFSIYTSVTLLSLGIGQYLILIYGAGQLATYALCAIFFVLALVPIAVTRIPQPTNVAVPKLIIRRLITISPLGVAGALVTGLVNGSFWGLGALYAHNMGYAVADIAVFMSAVIFGGALLQLPIGHQSDRFDRRKVLMFVCIFAALCAISIFLLASRSYAGLILSAIVYGGFSFAVYSLSVAHTNDHIDSTEVMDATSGLLLLNGIGAAIGPIIAGTFMQLYGAQALMIYFASVFGLLALFAFLRMGISTPVPAEEQGDFVAMSRTGTAALEMDPRTEPEAVLDT